MQGLVMWIWYWVLLILPK